MRKINRHAVASLLRRLFFKSTSLSTLFAAILMFAIPPVVQAQVAPGIYTVCSAGPTTCDYITPEAAVNDQARVDGDTIDILTDTYVLGATLQVDNSITILGNDSVLDANGIRAINVFGATTNFTMSEITIANGQPTPGFGGGAMWISGGATANVVNGTFLNNQAEFGGAIHNTGSTLQINVAEFWGNRATDGDGGAIFTNNLGISNLERTIINGNTASNAGGGVAVAGASLDPNGNGPRSFLRLNRSTVSNNVALDPVQTVSNLAVSTTSSDCGSIQGIVDPGPMGQTFKADAATLTAFEFDIRLYGPSGNLNVIPNDIVIIGQVRQGDPSGPIIATARAFAPGGVWPGSSTQTLTFYLDQVVALIPGDTYVIEQFFPGGYSIINSPDDVYLDGGLVNCSGTVSATSDFTFRTFSGTPGEGSGVHASLESQANLINTTVSGNVGDGVLATTGGLLSTWFNTITNNSGVGATATPEELEPDFIEAGLVFLTATIVAENGGDDCNGDMVTSGYNLIGEDTNCVLGPVPNPTDIIGTGQEPEDPLLGPLQDNGGFTPTHAIDGNSPAFDEAGPDDQGLPCFDFSNDQRDVARPNGPFCDIGAFEFAPPIGPLQTLINAADTGAIIDVPDGVYTESLTIGDDKTLRGSGPGNVVIDASNLGVSAITAAGDFTLDGIRVTGGDSPNNGGGIIANVAGTNINLINTVFDNNNAVLDGGAIYLLNGTIAASNVIFSNNSAGGNGGAILGGAASIITINAGLFQSNNATALGGSIYNEGTMSVVDTTIDGSDADAGGGVYNTNGSLDVDSSTFSDNNAINNGGAIAGAGTIDIVNSTISGNSAIGDGGGIGLTGGTARLNNVTLAFNASSGLGGPFYAEPDSVALIEFGNSLISDNTSDADNCGNVISLGYNLFQNAICQPVASDIIAEPLIGLLANNGGPTQTHALDPISPAIDAANPGQLVIELASALSNSQLSFNGVAASIGGNLVPVSGEFVAGSAYATAPDEGPFDLDGSFSTQFSFQITDPVAWSGNPGEPSGDGFTFAVAANQNVLGEPGGRLGVATTPGPLGTVSVEFDTFPNGGDISTNAIGINIGGFGDGQSVISAAQAAIPGNFDDGAIWTAWIDYQADTNRLDVRVAADGVRPELPQLTHTVNIAAVVGPTGYYGFTGGTGLAYATHSVTAWELFLTNCPSFDQRGVDRPYANGCDIGAFEGAPIPLALDQISLSVVTDLESGESHPGVTDVPIIDIPIEKLTGDTFNAPESAPLGSFPIGSFPIGSFDLRDSPLGSFPLGSFPIGSFPIGSFPLGSFPLSSIPLLTEGGWSEILNGIPELAGAPLQNVTLEQLLTISPLPDNVASIALRDLSIEGSALGSLSLPSLSLGDTTVAVLDLWAADADPGDAEAVCTTLSAADPPFTDCLPTDTLLGLEVKGAPVAALSLSSLPLGSFPIGSFPIGSFPIGSFPLGSFPIGSFPIGSFPIGSFPIGSFPIGSFPIGSFNLLAAPIGSFPLGSFPIGSFPIGSFEIDGKTFCEFYNEQALADSSETCEDLGVDPQTDSLADLVAILESTNPTDDSLSSTPLGSFPMGSFPIGSFPLGSFDLATLSAPPISLLTLAEIDGCTVIADNSSDTCSSLGLSNDSTLTEAAVAYGGTLAASPLGSFPIGSFDVSDLPMGSFPIGSFEVNGTPLGSFPIGSFDLINSPLGSFPIGSFSDGSCTDCMTLADAARAGALDEDATLADLKAEDPAQFATLKLGDVLDAMTLAVLYGPPDSLDDPGTLGEITDTGNLTLGQLLIAMLLKTDFPWETIPLDQLDAQSFSADSFVDYFVDIALTGTETEPLSIEVTLDDSFLYVEGSAILDIVSQTQGSSSTPIVDPVIFENEDGSQTLVFNLVLGGFSNNTMRFTTIPPLALGDYPASVSVALGSNDPLPADINFGTVTIIPDPLNDISDPLLAVSTPEDVLNLGYINEPDDNDFYQVTPPPEGARVAVFMANPAGDNDLIMYAPTTAIEEQGQQTESAPLDSVPFEDDGVDYEGNTSEEPNALEDVNLATAPLSSISTNRGDLDESVSAIVDDGAPFTIQVSGYNGAVSEQPYTLRVKVTPRVPSPQCSARTWPNTVPWPSPVDLPVPLAGSWVAPTEGTPGTNAVFLVNGARLASSDPNGAAGASDALSAISNLIDAPGITHGVVVDVSTIDGVDYTDWDLNPCDVDAPNMIVNAITAYIEEQRVISPNLTYVTIVGSDEVIPFARKSDETSIANESTYAGEFADNALFGALVTRHFLSDDSYGDIDPIPWLDRYLNVPELGVGRLVESAADIQLAAENYIAFAGVLDPQTALSAGYDFVADAAKDIDDTFDTYSPVFGYVVEDELIDEPGVDPLSAWDRDTFLGATGLNPTNPGDPVVPVDQVSFNMHFDFDEALPSSGDANGNYTDNLISTADLAGADLELGIWFTVGCHSGTNVPDISVVASAPSDDWAQAFSRLGALYLAQNAFGLGDTEALALTERLMANFALNLNGSLTIGQAHAFAKQQYFADLGLYGEYDYKAMQAATLFGLPMYQYGNGPMVTDPLPDPLPVAADPISGLTSASWSLDTNITQTPTDKGALFNVDGEVQFVHFRPLQPIVRRDVTSPDGRRASGAFLTDLVTEDILVPDIAFARPVIDLGEYEPEIETDEVVFPTAFTNIANYKAPPAGGGPFAPRDQLNVIVGQFTSPQDGDTDGTERLFRSLGTQIFYRPAATASAAPLAATGGDFVRPEFDNVQASIVGSTGSEQAAFSVDVFDEGSVLRVAVLYLKSVIDGKGNWALIDLIQGSGNTWTGGGPVEESAIANAQIDYMVQAVDDNGNVANSTFKGLFYVAESLPTAPPPSGNPGDIGVVITIIVDGEEVIVDPDDWIPTDPVDVTITDQDPDVEYEYSVDYQPFQPLTSDGFQITGDGFHIVTVRQTDGSNPVTFVVLIDTMSPTVVITSPANNEFVTQGMAPAADYDCLDAGSGITSCVGTVPDGDPVPSATTGAQSFMVTAQDDAGLGPTVAENVYYVVKPLEADVPVNPTPTSDPVTITASATDLDEFAETVTIDWGDGSPLEMPNMNGVNVSDMSFEHQYPEDPDVYQVTVTVYYEGQFTQIAVIDFVVVSQAGFVSGGGWIDSPPGAYTPDDSSDPDMTGKAHFGFVSMYKKGQSVPDGSTNFRFAAADLRFDATSYDWMIISGARARYKGEGTVNGGSELYKFQVTALDADISRADTTEDGFRIKIWQEGDGDTENVLYDNGLGADDATGNGGTTLLGGGSIKVHKAKK